MQYPKLTNVKYIQSELKDYSFNDKTTGELKTGKTLKHTFLGKGSIYVLGQSIGKEDPQILLSSYQVGKSYDVEISAYVLDRKTNVATGTLATATLINN